MNSKFNDAIESLTKLQHTILTHNLNKIHLQALQCSELFYLPDAINLIEGKKYDDDLKKMIKLPFGCISVLSGCSIIENNEEKYRTHKISIGFDVNCEQNLRFGWIDPVSINKHGYVLMSIVKIPDHIQYSINIKNLWVPNGLICFCEYPDGKDGKVLYALQPPEGEDIISYHGIDYNKAMSDYLVDSNSIENLCLLLSLHNVKTKTIKSPDKLNKKRISRGNNPLVDYHVLVVNGDIWDSEPSGKHNDGYRSHLRRGHIRRLDEERRVWVNSCFVRGRKDGFIDKEYNLSGKNYIN